jgi:hypothetical protein
MNEAHRLGLKVVTEGAVVLGAPVGTDQFIADDINKRVRQLTHDLAAVAHFTAHDKHTLIRLCINQRPVYLQRLLGLAHGSSAFQGFDDAVTDALLDTMKVVLPVERMAVRDQVHSLRSLPLHLSGSNVRHIGRPTTRVRALLLGRDNIARFHATCRDRNGGLCALLRAQWRLEHLLPQTHITPAAGYDPTTDADTAWAVLAGHTLGDIPASSIIGDFVSGDPDTSVARTEAVTRADNHAFAADLALHTQTLTNMRNSNQQHTRILAAHVLSSSCRHTGCVLQSLPIRGRAVQDGPYIQLMRIRLGVPCVMPPTQWHCNCRDHGGPHHSAYVERVSEANLDDDHQAASFATDPCHGLLCRRRWRRVTKRHDSIRDRLATVLGRVSGTSATVEPRVLQPQDGADQRRGDIKVSKHGNTWILDVGVVCPGTQRYVDQGSGTTPGLAAEAYAAVKVAKYADQDNFIPFILETGGRVNKAARDWLDALTAPEPGEQVPSQDDHPWNPQTRTTTETVLREAMQALVRVQAHMLARIVVEIRAADIAVELEPQL